MRGEPRPTRAGAALLALCGGLLLAGPAQAQVVNGNQLPEPRLTAITPAGAQVATTLEVTFAGTDLENPEALLFSHPGIKAVPIIPPLPPPPKADPKSKKPAPPRPPRPPITKFSVQVGADVPPGTYDVRLVNRWGVSNPRAFLVGDLNEVMEKEPNNDVDKAQKVDIGTTVSGVIANSTDVDYFAFPGKKGQHVLIVCHGPSIDSRLNPEMRLLDARERQIAFDRPMPGEDGLIDAVLPADGAYYLRLCQFTYTAGGADFFYRLSFSAAPHIDLVYPPMVEPGKASTVTVYGRNLPGGKADPAALAGGRPLEKITAMLNPGKDPMALQRLVFSGPIPPTGAMLDGFEYRIKSDAGISNPLLVTYAEAPVVLDNDNNDSADKAQAVNLPCEIAGKISKPAERDWYTFTAKKGDVYMIEVLSHRLGAPTDMFFSLRIPAKEGTQEIAQGDDDPTNLGPQGFFTPSRDPAPYRFVAPQDGKYYLLVGSHLADSPGDVRQVYRIRITPEHPDYRLFVLPTDTFRPGAVVVGKGGNETFSVFAWRRDGFKGDITVSMEGLPTGVTCPPQVLGGAMKKMPLVVSAAPSAPRFTGEVKVVGTAIINGQKVVREGRPATVTWGVQPQQGIPTITRLDKGLQLAVRDTAPYALTAPAKLTVFHGDKLTIALKAARLWPDMKQQIQTQPLQPELPPGLNLPAANIAPNATDATVVTAVAANVPPGTYTIVFRSFAPVPFNKDPKAKQKPNVNVVQSSTPCLVTILPKTVANLSVDNGNPTVKLGAQAVVSVRVARLHDFGDEFKVSLVLPVNVQGVTADPITIPAGQNEAKLTLRVPAGVPLGQRNNLIVRAVAVVNGNVPLTHEVKINVNVVK
jgi:hypothetical protein